MRNVPNNNGNESSTIIAVGQLSCDTVVTLDGPLAARDHNPGRAMSVPGGTAAIVAHNIAALGGEAVFAGHVGDGLEDRSAARSLREAGVKIGAEVHTPRGLRVVIVVEPNGERTMFATGDRPMWSDLNLSAHSGDLVFFEGWHLLGEVPDLDYVDLICRAAANGACVVLDVCAANNGSRDLRELLLRLPIDILLANEAEGEAIGLLEVPTSPTLIVHRGCKPTILLTQAGRREFPVDVVVPVDTTGAGDTFAAGFLLALHESEDVEHAVRRGLAAARAVVSIPGPLLPTAHAMALSTKSAAS